MSTRLATGAQVKQCLGVCKGVSGELSSETGGLSNRGAPPNAGGAPRVGGLPRVGLSRVGGAPQGGCPSTVSGFPQSGCPPRAGGPPQGRCPPRVGGLPQGGCLPGAGGAHPSTEGVDRTEGGGRWDLPFCTCLGVKLVSSHLLSPGPQASGLGVTHTTCFLGPRSVTAVRGTSQPPSSQEPSPHRKPPWGRTCPSPVSLESPYHQHIETETCVVYVM